MHNLAAATSTFYHRSEQTWPVCAVRAFACRNSCHHLPTCLPATFSSSSSSSSSTSSSSTSSSSSYFSSSASGSSIIIMKSCLAASAPSTACSACSLCLMPHRAMSCRARLQGQICTEKSSRHWAAVSHHNYTAYKHDLVHARGASQHSGLMKTHH